MAANERTFRVAPDEAGTRLDRFLSDRLETHTRSALRRWIRDGLVLVDGCAAAKPGLALKTGMELLVRVPEPPADSPQPESIPLQIVHEDDELLVVLKPAGLVVHPGHGRRSGTLVNALLGLGVPLAATGAPDRPGIVHRLDRDTSGLLAVAKTDRAHHALARAFAARRVYKLYRALVWGRPEPAEGSIERPIGRSMAHPLKMAVGRTRGTRRAAVTHYATTETLPGFALLEIRLHTGRTHQIRVHLQSIHHPVVGDAQYGGRAWRGVQDPLKRTALRGFDRLALHAAELGFTHPVSGEEVRFRSPLPDEFEELLRVLRRSR